MNNLKYLIFVISLSFCSKVNLESDMISKKKLEKLFEANGVIKKGEIFNNNLEYIDTNFLTGVYEGDEKINKILKYIDKKYKKCKICGYLHPENENCKIKDRSLNKNKDKNSIQYDDEKEDLSSNGWECKSCTYKNKNDYDKCEICGEKKSDNFHNKKDISEPKKKKKKKGKKLKKRYKKKDLNSKGWKCTSCTYENKDDRDKCEICHTKRSKTIFNDDVLFEIESDNEKDTWSCFLCSSENKYNTNVCSTCKTENKKIKIKREHKFRILENKNWECNLCSHENHKSSSSCIFCDTKRPIENKVINIFLVHGYNSNKTIWNDLIYYIKLNLPKNVKYKIIAETHPGLNCNEEKSLNKAIKDAKEKLERYKGKFIFIGHSMGGCLLAALLNYDNISKRVDYFIAIGSPLEGISDSNKVINIGDHFMDFKILQSTLKNKNWVQSNITSPLHKFKSKKIFLIAGNSVNVNKHLGFDNSIGEIFNFFGNLGAKVINNNESSDGITTVKSALCKNTLSLIPHKNKLIVEDCHTNLVKNYKVINFIIQNIFGSSQLDSYKIAI